MVPAWVAEAAAQTLRRLPKKDNAIPSVEIARGSVAAASRRWCGLARKEAAALVLVALFVRVIAAWGLGSVDLAVAGSVWQWGYEASSVGFALTEGRGYADPFGISTGPTGWLPPMFPALLAACFALGGGLTTLTAGLFFGAQAILAALTCPLIAGIGVSCGAPRAGRLGAWIFVVYPAAVWTTATVVWDTTLTAFVLTLLMHLLLKHGRGIGPARALAFGALIGAGLLVSASLLVLLPIALLASVGRPLAWRRLAANGLALAAGAVLVTSPWLARNALVLGTPALRTNLGVELHVGNNDLADGRMQHAYHPSLEPVETARFLAIGEVAYCAEAHARALAWIRANPERFARVSARRMQLWWLGEDPFDDPRTEGPLRARDDWRNWVRWLQHAFCGALALGGAVLLALRGMQGKMLLALLVLFPLPYYVTHIYERYRFPIEPVIVFLASWLTCEAYAAARALVSTRTSRAARSIAQEG